MTLSQSSPSVATFARTRFLPVAIRTLASAATRLKRPRCAFADGSVHQLRGDIPAKAALHLFQMNDGSLVDIEQLK